MLCCWTQRASVFEDWDWDGVSIMRDETEGRPHRQLHLTTTTNTHSKRVVSVKVREGSVRSLSFLFFLVMCSVFWHVALDRGWLLNSKVQCRSYIRRRIPRYISYDEFIINENILRQPLSIEGNSYAYERSRTIEERFQKTLVLLKDNRLNARQLALELKCRAQLHIAYYWTKATWLFYPFCARRACWSTKSH